jgi:hypothetical protein
MHYPFIATFRSATSELLPLSGLVVRLFPQVGGNNVLFVLKARDVASFSLAASWLQ